MHPLGSDTVCTQTDKYVTGHYDDLNFFSFHPLGLSMYTVRVKEYEKSLMHKQSYFFMRRGLIMIQNQELRGLPR